MSSSEAKFLHGGLPLFFAFQDGQIGYNCEHCDGRCCRQTSALSLLPHQLEDPGLEVFTPLVSDLRRGAVQVDIGLDGCPGLLPSGSCRIHADSGRLHKPVTCALFPFNILVRTRQFCAVVPHFRYACPLVFDPPAGYTVGTRQQVAADLSHFYGDLLEPFTMVAAPEHEGVSYEYEGRLLATVNHARGKRSLTAALAEASGGGEADLRQRAEGALALMGLEPVWETPADVELLLPMVPALRAAFYQLRLQEIDVAMVVAWRFVVAASPPKQASGLRRIASLFERFNELVALLAQAELSVRLEGPLRRRKGGVPEVALEVMLILRDAQRFPTRFTLAELLSRHGQSRGVHRTLVLRELSRAGLKFV